MHSTYFTKQVTNIFKELEHPRTRTRPEEKIWTKVHKPEAVLTTEGILPVYFAHLYYAKFLTVSSPSITNVKLIS